jgi:antitoxin (DNA-binding transcriptional repressor) of toxin-antitoxin stability system
MKTYSVADFKANFSDILSMVQDGEEVAIAYGKRKEVVAVLSPKQKVKPVRKLGTLEHKGKVIIHDDWKMTAEELLGE